MSVVISLKNSSEPLKIVNSMHFGIIKGINAAIIEYIQHVAKITGLLRTSLKSMLVSQTASLQGRRTVTISFQPITTPSYAKYHIDVQELNPNYNIYSYKNPTTSGTRPIKAAELLRLVKEKIIEFLTIRFNGQNKTYTDYVEVV